MIGIIGGGLIEFSLSLREEPKRHGFKCLAMTSAASRAVVSPRRYASSRRALLGLVDNLEATVRSLRSKPRGTAWSSYYDDNFYTSDEFQRKARLVAEFLHPEAIVFAAPQP